MMPKATPTFAELTALLKTSPSSAAMEARRLSEKLTTMRYEVAAIGVGYAYCLARDEDKRALFYQNPFWQARMKKPNHDKLLLHCMMYVYGSHRGSEAKRAGDHARALQSAYAQKMAVEDIPEHIKSNGGFDGLLSYTFDGIADEDAADAVEAPRKKGKPSSEAPQPSLALESRDDEELSAEEVDDDDDDRMPPPSLKARRADRAKSGGNGRMVLKPMPRDKIMEFLIVEADQPLFDAILGMKVGANRKQLTVKRLPDSPDHSAHGDHVPFKRFQLSAG